MAILFYCFIVLDVNIQQYNNITMNPVEDFIYQLEGEQRALLLYLHHILTTELNLEAKIRYKIPFYYGKRWICYLNPTKDNKIDLSFIYGNQLSNEQGLLESRGRKQVCSITLDAVKNIPIETLYEILQEAILLDEVG